MAAWGEIEHYLKTKFSLGIPKHYQTYIFFKIQKRQIAYAMDFSRLTADKALLTGNIGQIFENKQHIC